VKTKYTNYGKISDYLRLNKADKNRIESCQYRGQNMKPTLQEIGLRTEPREVPWSYS